MSITPADLRRVALLTELDDKELTRLSKDLKERVAENGTELLSEGRGGIGFFMILDGHAQVKVGGETVATLGPGDHFGELALLDGDNPRSAAVVAEGELHCAAMSTWQFRPFVKDHPTVAWRLLQTLAQRLRESNAARATA